MTDQTPEVVAAADVSPVSPKPIHTSATSPALVPSLQDHAATLDVAYLDSLTTAPFPFVTMPATPSANPANDDATATATTTTTAAATAGDSQSSPVADTIVVRGDDDSGGDNEDEDEVIDDESLDAYGEDDDEQQDAAGSAPSSLVVQQAAESGDGADAGTATAQPDVTEASSESMINTPSATSSSPESNTLMKSESPAAVPSQSAEPSATTLSTDGTADAQHGNPQAETEPQMKADDTVATSDAAAAAISEEDSAGVDIQKLVESITAPSTAPPPSATTASVPQAPSEAVTSPAKPTAPSISLPQSSSLPPKPVMPQQAGQPGSRPEDFHPFPSRPANNAHGPPPMSMQGVIHSRGTPNASMVGVASEGVSSLPPIPQTSFNGGSDHYGSLPSAIPAPGAGAAQRVPLHGTQLQQAWETFQDDEKRYMTEAEWGRFPDNSRIFIGERSTPQPLHGSYVRHLWLVGH